MPSPLRHLLMAALLLAPAFQSRAGQSFSPRTDTSVTLRVESWLESCPPSGLVPLRFHATNRTASTGSWSISVSGGNSGGALVTSGTLTVEGGQDGEITLYAMTPALERSSGYYRNLTISVSGPGVRNNMAGQLSNNSSGSSNPTEYIGMSKKLSAKGWSALKAKFVSPRGGGSSELDGTEVEMAQAPDDWRGYTGLVQLWMDESEWLGMSTQSKAALLDWVAFGGRVCLLVSDASEARLDELKLPRKVNTRRSHGAGVISAYQWDGKALPMDTLVKTIREAGKNSLRAQLTSYNSKWSLRQSVGQIGLKSGLIFGFIAIFGILIGPVNLFILAGPKQRQRLFWTTPLLSLAGSSILVMLMILQDGIGGGGSRFTLALLQPDQKKMSLVQEQASKTGVLFKSSFTMNEQAWTEPLIVPREGGAFSISNDARRRHSREGDVSTGDWFSSRSVQSQLLMTVRPSRAAIEVFPAADAGGAPSVLSSIEVTLEKVLVIDDAFHYWKVDNLGTGEKKLMQPSSLKEYQDWHQERLISEGGRVTTAISEACKNSPGFAYAESKNASRLALKTLPSIRWNSERLVFMGPYVKH